MRIAALIKQIPAFEEMAIGPDGRLVREGREREMNPYCRRAVAQAVALAAAGGHDCTVVTLGPPAAEDVLREAVAWARERGVDAQGVLVTDPAFAGSDTLATARALVAALIRTGPFDLMLLGRNSVDADTGQVGPQIAQLLGLPFLPAVRAFDLDGDVVRARCETDDGALAAEVRVPVVVATAERLIDPCKVPPEGRAAVPAGCLRVITAAELGTGPWGVAASPTWVGETRPVASARLGRVLTASADRAAREAVALLADRGAFTDRPPPVVPVPPVRAPGGPAVVVLVEPGRPHDAREQLGAAAGLAREVGGHALALRCAPDDDATLASWGADAVVSVTGVDVEDDVAREVAEFVRETGPWAVLAPGTTWGREIAGRVAAAAGAGLTGDAVELEAVDGRLVAWKAAFGGQLVAAVHCTTPTQMATVRVGVLPTPAPRSVEAPPVTERVGEARSRTVVTDRTRDDDLDLLAEAAAVIGVGRGVDPADYGALEALRVVLGAELAATRKVTDQGWMPRARQIGITGRSIAPRLFVSLGASGKFNHMVGVRNAGTVLAVNPDPDAPVFSVADVGIVGDWREVVPALVAAVETHLGR